MGINGMSIKKKLILLTVSSLILYGIIIGLFVLNFMSLSTSIANMEQQYLLDVEQRIKDSFKDNNISESLIELGEKYPIEVIVEQDEKTLYQSIPIPLNQAKGILNQEAVLLEVKGEVKTSTETYDVWYAIYRMPLETYIGHFFFAQNGLIVLSTLLLLVLVAFLHAILLKPLYRIRKSIKKMDEYHFEEVEQGEDIINQELSLFATKLDASIKAVSRKHTELEMQLQTNKERLHNTVLVSRGLVHDLKSPIHQLMLENDMMMDELKTPEVTYMGQTNVKAIDGFLKEINSILAVLSQDQYGVDIQYETIDIMALVSKSIRQHGAYLHAKELELELEMPEQTTIVFSLVTMILLINNLLSNMIKYAVEGSQIRFSLDVSSNRLVIETENESSQEDIDRMSQSENLFNVVVEEATNNHVYSSGNGLFLIKDLVHIMKGQFMYETKQSRVIMHVELPLKNDA